MTIGALALLPETEVGPFLDTLNDDELRTLIPGLTRRLDHRQLTALVAFLLVV